MKLPGDYEYKKVKRKKIAKCKLCNIDIHKNETATIVNFCYDIPTTIAILCSNCVTEFKLKCENK